LSSHIDIDGTIGGGSVIRLGVPLAIAMKKTLRVTNIRQVKERRTGLQVQHLTGLDFLAQITGSQLMGNTIGSPELFVTPGNSLPPTNFLPKIQIPTAAAVSLIIQILSNYVFASRIPIGFEFEGGGTHIRHSPNFDILLHVNKPLFELFGVRLHIQLIKPGYYPQGGGLGRIFLEPLPVPQTKIVITSGKLKSVEVFSYASANLKTQRVAEKQLSGFKSVLNPTKEYIGYANSSSTGYSCSSVLKYEGNSIKGIAEIGSQSDAPEDVGKAAGLLTKKNIDNPASVDEQLADQLILPLAFAPSGSEYTFDGMYEHVNTNLEVIKQIMGENVLKLQKEGTIYRLTKV
jgi:RNA 3'-terminal phosphate cyclase (ATP)